MEYAKSRSNANDDESYIAEETAELHEGDPYEYEITVVTKLVDAFDHYNVTVGFAYIDDAWVTDSISLSDGSDTADRKHIQNAIVAVQYLSEIMDETVYFGGIDIK